MEQPLTRRTGTRAATIGLILVALLPLAWGIEAFLTNANNIDGLVVTSVAAAGLITIRLCARNRLHNGIGFIAGPRLIALLGLVVCTVAFLSVISISLDEPPTNVVGGGAPAPREAWGSTFSLCPPLSRLDASRRSDVIFDGTLIRGSPSPARPAITHGGRVVREAIPAGATTGNPYVFSVDRYVKGGGGRRVLVWLEGGVASTSLRRAEGWRVYGYPIFGYAQGAKIAADRCDGTHRASAPFPFTMMGFAEWALTALAAGTIAAAAAGAVYGRGRPRWAASAAHSGIAVVALGTSLAFVDRPDALSGWIVAAAIAALAAGALGSRSPLRTAHAILLTVLASAAASRGGEPVGEWLSWFLPVAMVAAFVAGGLVRRVRPVSLAR